MKIGYQQTKTFLIERSKHRVTFKIGTSVTVLKEMLRAVPDTAQVDEIEWLVDEDDDICYIEFHNEKLISNDDQH